MLTVLIKRLFITKQSSRRDTKFGWIHTHPGPPLAMLLPGPLTNANSRIYTGAVRPTYIIENQKRGFTIYRTASTYRKLATFHPLNAL